MEKISLTIAWDNDGKPTVIAEGTVEECEAAYRANTSNDKYAFLGMLRKPTWHKRVQPGSAKRRKTQRTERTRKQEQGAARSRAEHLEQKAEAAMKAADAATAEAKLLREKEGSLKPASKPTAPAKKKTASQKDTE